MSSPLAATDITPLPSVLLWQRNSDFASFLQRMLRADTAVVSCAKEKEIAVKLEEKKEIEAKLLEEENAATEKDSEVAMDAEVWKEFPLELHQHIHQYCSVPELCRLRVVCRSWNDLIHHSTHFPFRAQLQNRYILISADDVDIRYKTKKNWRSYKPVNTNLGNGDAVNTSRRNSWELIDVSTKKIYWINKEFMYDGVLNQYASMDYDEGWFDRVASIDLYRTMAADKGLLCVLWKSFWREVMQIVNPVTRSVIEVPLFECDRRVYMNAQGAMTVAEDYSSFTLYFIFDNVNGDRMLSLVRFDSQVGKWRVLHSQRRINIPMHLLKLNESLYALLSSGFETQLLTFAFNTVSETWTDTRMELPTKKPWKVMPQLVTALGRLFIVMLDDERHDTFVNNDIDFSVQILELDVFSNTYSILTTMDEIYPGGEIPQKKEFRRDNTAVVGCGNFIVLTSGTGRSIAYNLLNDVWSDWSLIRWMSAQELDTFETCRIYGLFGMAMTPTLHPVPRLQQEEEDEELQPLWLQQHH